MNIKIRINNVAFRPCVYIGEPPKDANLYGDIVYYEPNKYYGKLEEYLKDGWEDKGECITKNVYGVVSISKSMFDLEETCYTIARLKYDSREYCCDLKTIGSRLLYEMPEKDRNDFWEVYRLADQKLTAYNKELAEEP